MRLLFVAVVVLAAVLVVLCTPAPAAGPVSPFGPDYEWRYTPTVGRHTWVHKDVRFDATAPAAAPAYYPPPVAYYPPAQPLRGVVSGGG